MNKTLQEAADLIGGDRQVAYGPPGDSMARIAELWTTAFGHQFTSADVALAMILLKCARISNKGDVSDSWVDVAGYAAIGAEVWGNAK